MKVTDERLEELIAIWEFLVQKTLPLVGEEVDLNKEYMDAVSVFKELQSLRMHYKLSQENLGEVMTENRLNCEHYEELKHGIEQAVEEIDRLTSGRSNGSEFADGFCDGIIAVKIVLDKSFPA